MKKLVLVMLLGVLMLSGCKASSINRVVNTIGEEAGVDVNLDIKQEDLDKIEEEANKVKDKVQDIIEDTEVQEATKDLFDALIDVSKDN